MQKFLVLLLLMFTYQNLVSNSTAITTDLYNQNSKNQICKIQAPAHLKYTTPLHEAVAKNDIHLMLEILRSNRKAAHAKDHYGKTPLFLASSFQAIGVLVYNYEKVQERKDYIELLDNSKTTALDDIKLCVKKEPDLIKKQELQRAYDRLKVIGATEQCQNLSYLAQTCNIIGFWQTPCRDRQGTIWYRNLKNS
jgi:hypothetical protein